MNGDNDMKKAPEARTNNETLSANAGAVLGDGNNAGDDSGHSQRQEESQENVASRSAEEAAEEIGQSASDTRPGSGRHSHKNRMERKMQRMQEYQTEANGRVDSENTTQGVVNASESGKQAALSQSRAVGTARDEHQVAPRNPGSAGQAYQDRVARKTRQMEDNRKISSETTVESGNGSNGRVEESSSAPGDALAAASHPRTHPGIAAASQNRISRKTRQMQESRNGSIGRTMETADSIQGRADGIEEPSNRAAPGDELVASLMGPNPPRTAHAERGNRKLHSMEEQAPGDALAATASAGPNQSSSVGTERHTSKMRSMEEHTATTGSTDGCGRAVNTENHLLDPEELLNSGTSARTTVTGVSSTRAAPTGTVQLESSPDDPTDNEHVAPHFSTAVDENGELRPGAYSAPGRAFGEMPEWGRHRRRSIVQRFRQSIRRSSLPSEANLSVSAVLVEEDDEESPTLVSVEAIPVPNENVMHKRLLIGGFVLLVVIGIIVAVTVPLTANSDSQSSVVASGSGPTRSPQPTTSPTQFPTTAPTSMTTITVVIQLDEKPEETGWSLECGSAVLVSIPSQSYKGQKNRRVTVPVVVGVGDECRMTVTDSKGNGVDDGYLELYFGSGISDPAAKFSEESLTFTDSMEHLFTVESAPTMSPTISPAPTSSSLVSITVFIQFDRHPAEIGWSLDCGGINIATALPGTYIVADQNTTETYNVEEGVTCEFAIGDLYGDGFCCLVGDGFYQIFLGEGTGEESVLLVQGDGEVGFETRVSFAALPLVPTASPAPSTSPAPTFFYCTSLCPDESPIDPQFHDVVAYESVQGNNVTCEEHEAEAMTGILSERDCLHANYIGVKRCGCSATVGACDICEDGSIPPYPNLQSGLAQLTCEEIAIYLFHFSATSATCAASQAGAGVYCGCDNPVSSASACRICGGENFIPDASLGTISDFGDSTCQQLEYYANTQASEVQCSLAQDIGRDSCCSGANFTRAPVGPTTSPAPSPLPSSEPTFSPVSCDEGFVPFHLSLTLDVFPGETKWELLSESAGVILEGGPYLWLGDVGLQISEHTCLSIEECGVFTIYDLYEDGIHGEFGPGQYSIYLDGQEVETSRGDFVGPSESTRVGNCPPTTIPTSAP